MAHIGHANLSLEKPLGSDALPGAAGENWVGGAGGDGDWNTAADWSGDSVPSASATVTFATGNFGYTVTGDATIGAIVVDGDGVTFDGAITQNTGGPATFLTGLDGAYVTLDSNAFFSGGALDFSYGSLLEVQGILITTGGTADVMLVDGLNANVIASSQLDFNQLYVQNGASFTGDVAVNDGGNITLDTSSTFGGGTITLLGSALIYEAAAAGQQGGTGSISGDIFASGGTLNLATDPGVTLLVSGQINDAAVLVSGGTVEISGDTNTYVGPLEAQNGTLVLDDVAPSSSQTIVLANGAVVFGTDSSAGTGAGDVVFGTGNDTVNAGAANVLVFGSATGLTFIGGTGLATVVSGAGDVNVASGSGNELVYGGTGTLTYTGGSGDDTVVGGTGVVIASGGTGADLIYGGTSGHDVLTTGAGNTSLVGGAGTTFIANGAGNAAIAATQGGLINANAASGNDTLFAGGAATTIVGGYAGVETDVLGAGNTTVYGGSGTSDIFGGGGNAQIYLTQGFGGGTINVVGLSLSHLDITLVNYSQGEAASVLANETVAGGNTYLTLSDNTHVDLFGITGLTSANFS